MNLTKWVIALVAIIVLFVGCTGVVHTPQVEGPELEELTIPEAFEQGPLHQASTDSWEPWCRVQLSKSQFPWPDLPQGSLLTRMASSRSQIEQIIRKRMGGKLPAKVVGEHGESVSGWNDTTVNVLEYRRGTTGGWTQLQRKHIAKRRGGGMVLDLHGWTAGGSATLQLRWRGYSVIASTAASAPSGYTEVSGARSIVSGERNSAKEQAPDIVWKVFLHNTGSAGTTKTITVTHGTRKGCHKRTPSTPSGSVSWSTIQAPTCPAGQTAHLKLYGNDAFKARWLYCPEYGTSGATCSQLRLLNAHSGHTRRTSFWDAAAIQVASLRYEYEGVEPNRQRVFEYIGGTDGQQLFINPEFYYDHAQVCDT